MHSFTLELLLRKTYLMQRFSYSRKALILRPHRLTGPDLRTQHWAGIESSLFVSKEASHTAFSQAHQRFLLSLYQSNQLLRCHSMQVFFYITETIPCLTFSHSLSLFTYFTIFCSHTHSVSSHYCFPSSPPCRGSGFCYGSGKATRSGRDPN